MKEQIILLPMQSKAGCLRVEKTIHKHFSSTINETFPWACLFNNIILMYTAHAALSWGTAVSFVLVKDSCMNF